MKRFFLVLLVVVLLAGCATASGRNSPPTLEKWSRFAGQKVEKIGEVFPDGDVPRDIFWFPGGAGKIF